MVKLNSKVVKLKSERKVKVDRKPGSLMDWPLVPEVMGSILAAGEDKFRCPNVFLSVLCRDDTR